MSKDSQIIRLILTVIAFVKSSLLFLIVLVMCNISLRNSINLKEPRSQLSIMRIQRLQKRTYTLKRVQNHSKRRGLQRLTTLLSAVLEIEALSRIQAWVKWKNWSFRSMWRMCCRLKNHKEMEEDSICWVKASLRICRSTIWMPMDWLSFCPKLW